VFFAEGETVVNRRTYGIGMWLALALCLALLPGTARAATVASGADFRLMLVDANNIPLCPAWSGGE